jgi:hypothetical protein
LILDETLGIGSGFERLLDYGLPQKGRTIRQLVREDLGRARSRKQGLEQQRYPPAVLRLILDLMVSRSYFRESRIQKLSDRLKQELGDESRLTFDFMKTSRCEALLREFGIEEKVKKLTDQLVSTSLREWLYDRHVKRTQKDDKDALLEQLSFGDKGIDELLRDCGYFDRVPIDIHEQRFQVRTGIFQQYSPSCDPLDKREYHEALICFCRNELQGLRLSEYSLDNSPGIVDWAIWYFCSKNYGRVCRDTPQCVICPLNHECLFGVNRLSTRVRRGKA